MTASQPTHFASCDEPTMRFLARANARIDLQSCTSSLNAVEHKIGLRLSTVMIRLMLLDRWLTLDASDFDAICERSEVLRWFIGVSPSGPIVDVWLYRQLIDRIRTAEVEIHALCLCVERQLATHGIRPPRRVRDPGHDVAEPAAMPSPSIDDDISALFAIASLADTRGIDHPGRASLQRDHGLGGPATTQRLAHRPSLSVVHGG